MNASLEQEFNEEVLALFTKTGQTTGYWPRYFLRKARKVGGYRLAKDLLQPATKAATGFGRLAETNHLELSVEYLALQPKWSPLFTEKERQVARSRLEEAGGIAIPGDPPADSPAIQDLRRQLGELQRPGRPKTPDTLKLVQRILKSYERPSPITRYVKRMRGSTCQLCGDPGFLMRNGQRYCEAHHLFHLSKNPPPACLGPEYLVVLCATCHRRMHYADVGEPVRETGGWQVRVDDDEVLIRV